MADRTYRCPVCGYPDLLEPPRTEGCEGSYEICPSCGFQFGVTDEDRGFTYEAWRRDWIARECHWSSMCIHAPQGWNPKKQLESLLGR